MRPIAENMNDGKRLAPYIREAENLYLKPVIGAKLYKDIEENKTEYSILLDGGPYDNDTKDFPGLREAMGYLVFNRFARNDQVNVTAFSLVYKVGEFSERVDDRTVVRIVNDAEKIGLEYLHQCIEYMRFMGMLEKCKPIRKIRKFKAIGR